MIIKFSEFNFNPIIANTVHNPVNIKKIFDELKKRTIYSKETFKEFATKALGETEYKNFLITNGYTDYENDDAFDVIENYGLEDNYCCWTGLSIPWKNLILSLAHKIGMNNIRFSCSATKIFKFDSLNYIIQ